MAPIGSDEVHSTPGPSKHLPGLDGLRGAAVLLVMGSHFIGFYPVETNAIHRAVRLTLSVGWCGVDLFFVLSGFLITGILLDSNHKPSRQYFRNFYIRRMLRIFPLYYCFIGALAFLALMYPRLFDVQHELLWYFLYLQNWRHAFGHVPEGISHFWSLAIEEQFYLIWPIVIFYTNKRTILKAIVLVSGSLVVLRLILVLKFAVPAVFLYTATITRLDGLVLGALAALCLRHPYWSLVIREWSSSLVLASLATLLWLAAVSHSVNILGSVTPFVIFSPVAFAVLFTALIVKVVANNAGPWHWSWLRMVGKYSYAMYVFHYPIFVCVRSEVFRKNLFDYTALTSGPMWRGVFWGTTLFGACTILSFAIASFSWWILESRMSALKDRFI